MPCVPRFRSAPNERGASCTAGLKAELPSHGDTWRTIGNFSLPPISEHATHTLKVCLKSKNMTRMTTATRVTLTCTEGRQNPWRSAACWGRRWGLQVSRLPGLLLCWLPHPWHHWRRGVRTAVRRAPTGGLPPGRSTGAGCHPSSECTCSQGNAILKLVYLMFCNSAKIWDLPPSCIYWVELRTGGPHTLT
jgi:hypothetical protein